MNVLSTIILTGMLACIMLGAIYLRIWLNDRSHLASLFFSLTALSVAFYAVGELSMMHAATVGDFVRALYWTDIPSWISHLTFVLFVWFYLGGGRRWLLGTGIVLRTIATIISLLSPYSINFTEITGIRHIDFYGESLSVAVGTRNPLMVIGQLGTLVVLAYCVDSAIAVWRRGDRQLARWFGTIAVVFIGGRLVDTVLVMWGTVNFPLTASPFFMGFLFAMAWQLGTAPKREQQLTTELEKSNDESLKWLSAMNIASDAGEVGVWIREVETGLIWANQEYRTIFGFSEDDEITMERVLERIHSDDKESFILDLEKSFLKTGEISQEYHLVLPDGSTRWIKTRKRFETPRNGPTMVFGAAADITNLKLAEDKAHELGGRMIEVLETERSRLARELHDDLSQRLALLSIQLSSLERSDKVALPDRIHELSESISQISADVHRISHELHPSRLDQLGLAASIRGFCRELTSMRGTNIRLVCADLPPSIPRDVSLCVYRLTQEALQNVAKHSGKNEANVSVSIQGSELVLNVLDNGAGFDTNDSMVKESLGLISMRERVKSVNGTFDISSLVGLGTVVEARIPLAVGIVPETPVNGQVRVSHASIVHAAYLKIDLNSSDNQD